MRRLSLHGFMALALAVVGLTQAGGVIQFNESFIRGLHSRLDVGNELTVFDRVFSDLPTKVFVYPTENYYYFTFTANGRVYSGNLRISPDSHFTRRIHFAYGEASNVSDTHYLHLGVEQGVLVEPIAPLRYRVSFAGKRVVFELNGLSQIPPRGFRVLPWETFLGRSMDESGIGFLLLYNLAHDHFFWILDEENGPDWSMRSIGPDVYRQPESGFVFFRDWGLGRSVLVGVDRSEVLANSYYDGPFDQLPDNFIGQTPFAELVQRAFPSVRGYINRRGEYRDIPARVALLNYRIYSDPRELVGWTAGCRVGAHDRADLYACLTRMSPSPRSSHHGQEPLGIGVRKASQDLVRYCSGE